MYWIKVLSFMKVFSEIFNICRIYMSRKWFTIIHMEEIIRHFRQTHSILMSLSGGHPCWVPKPPVQRVGSSNSSTSSNVWRSYFFITLLYTSPHRDVCSFFATGFLVLKTWGPSMDGGSGLQDLFCVSASLSRLPVLPLYCLCLGLGKAAPWSKRQLLRIGVHV